LTLLNARALTIYLWHVPIIVAVTYAAVWAGLPIFGAVGIGWRLVVVTGLLALVVLLVGWVEDVAAGRRPTLIPGGVPKAIPVSPAPAPAPALGPAVVGAAVASPAVASPAGVSPAGASPAGASPVGVNAAGSPTAG
jgi:peptidoglycan/LPS O-acetylase OafA/YrhL